MGWFASFELTMFTFDMQVVFLWLASLIRTGITSPIVYIIMADYLPDKAMNICLIVMFIIDIL
jgi:hypothetical protein